MCMHVFTCIGTCMFYIGVNPSYVFHMINKPHVRCKYVYENTEHLSKENAHILLSMIIENLDGLMILKSSQQSEKWFYLILRVIPAVESQVLPNKMFFF